MTRTTTNPFDDDHLHEECAIFGIYGTREASINTALGLHALQHRGQEAAGIVSFDGEQFPTHRDMGLVGDIFGRHSVIDRLSGHAAINEQPPLAALRDRLSVAAWVRFEPGPASLDVAAAEDLAGPPIDSPDGQCSIAPSYESDDEQMPSPGAIKRTKERARRANATVNALGRGAAALYQDAARRAADRRRARRSERNKGHAALRMLEFEWCFRPE